MDGKALVEASAQAFERFEGSRTGRTAESHRWRLSMFKDRQ